MLHSLSLHYFTCILVLFFLGIQVRNIFKEEAYKDTSALRIIGAIGRGITFSQIMVGLIFTFNEWQGAVVVFTVGLSGLIVVTIVGLI